MNARSQSNETVSVMKSSHKRAHLYGNKGFDSNLGQNIREVCSIKLMSCICYVMELQIEWMKWREMMN